MPTASNIAPPGFQLRPARPEEAEIVYTLYASTRQTEMALLGWGLQQTESFLRMQFQAQTRHYLAHYPDAHVDLLEWRQQIIGRLIVDYQTATIVLVDIALLPEFQGRGLGSDVLKALLAEAVRLTLPVTLHVQRSNPAVQLYQGLGFLAIADAPDSIYMPMVWQPPTVS